MTVDILEPGDDARPFPYFPRDLEGRPLWADTHDQQVPQRAIVNGRVVDGVMPVLRGLRWHARPYERRRYRVDLTPYDAQGRPLEVPALTPEQLAEVEGR